MELAGGAKLYRAAHRTPTKRGTHSVISWEAASTAAKELAVPGPYLRRAPRSRPRGPTYPTPRAAPQGRHSSWGAGAGKRRCGAEARIRIQREAGASNRLEAVGTAAAAKEPNAGSLLVRSPDQSQQNHQTARPSGGSQRLPIIVWGIGGRQEALWGPLMGLRVRPPGAFEHRAAIPKRSPLILKSWRPESGPVVLLRSLF